MKVFLNLKTLFYFAIYFFNFFIYNKLVSESFDFSDAPIGTNLDNEEDANSLFDSLGI